MLDCQLKKYYSSRETEQMIFNLLSISKFIRKAIWKHVQIRINVVAVNYVLCISLLM